MGFKQTFLLVLSLLTLTSTSCVSGASRVYRCVSSVNSCQGAFLDSTPTEPSVRGFQKIEDVEDWKNNVELWGVPDGATKMVYIGRLSAEPNRDSHDVAIPGDVMIGYIEVESKFRERGAQDAMFAYFLSKNPTVKKIATGLTETNAAIFRSALIERLKEVDRDFNGNIEAKLKSLPQHEVDSLLKWAYDKTPAAKSRYKFKFELCKGPGSVNIENYDTRSFTVWVTTCR
ncbi:hypothetical protein [Bdellovibrio svalbardensis]|uniref:Lipoprotein n=1 Tax=Bdellovibrio svalbardensis TaxID=2972972 RepID=A0ABT6DQG0_9BACT|nr:hypothetical protein [Bdellovibrio svalbardensis]MDG0818056.1 hypothetical protein [Bdellovibrio svalbardensis]